MLFHLKLLNLHWVRGSIDPQGRDFSQLTTRAGVRRGCAGADRPRTRAMEFT